MRKNQFCAASNAGFPPVRRRDRNAVQWCVTRQSRLAPVRRRYASRRDAAPGLGRPGSFGMCDQPTITRGEDEMSRAPQPSDHQSLHAAWSTGRHLNAVLPILAEGACDGVEGAVA